MNAESSLNSCFWLCCCCSEPGLEPHVLLSAKIFQHWVITWWCNMLQLIISGWLDINQNKQFIMHSYLIYITVKLTFCQFSASASQLQYTDKLQQNECKVVQCCQGNWSPSTGRLPPHNRLLRGGGGGWSTKSCRREDPALASHPFQREDVPLPYNHCLFTQFHTHRRE